MSLIVELRAVWFYRLYQETLSEHELSLSLRSVLAEEELHLDAMLARLARHGFELRDARDAIPGAGTAKVPRAVGRDRSRVRTASAWRPSDMDIRRILIVAGIVLLVAGLLWPCLTRLGLGRLPGDIVIERENFRFYFPLVTSILVSVVLTALFWLFRR